MKKRIVTLLMALIMLLGLIPTIAFAEEDGSIKIYMSVSNAGTLATCADGKAMAFREVTVTDDNGDGKITFHEALIAAHNAYYSGGAADGYDAGTGFVQKIWGVANGGSYFFNQNDISIPVGVMEQPISNQDYLTVCIMKDAAGYTDIANTYFKEASGKIVKRVEINAKESLQLTLIGCVLDYNTWQTVPTALSGVAVGVWQNGAFAQLDSLTTDQDGKAEVSFDEPGTYILTAEGSFDGKAIMAPTCLVTVKSDGTDPGNPDPGTTDPGNPDPGNPDPGNPPPATPQDVSKVLNDTMDQLAKTVTAPAFGTGAGEWTVLDLARGGYYALDSQYFKDYYSRIVETVNQKAASVNLDGALHKVKSTENSRLIMALSAIGKDATSVGNWDLIKPYSTRGIDWITRQGINGPIFALIALDTHNYPTTDTTIRQQCVDYILGKELSGGGWALSGTEADPDITAMALQALVNYKDQPEVAAAAERAFAKLSAIQKDNGGYASWGSVNSESIAQVIVATTAWGIDPDTDPRFVKNGKSAVDALLTFYVEEGRGFAHVLENSPGYVGGEVNGMATDQACYALVAYNRFQNGKTALYDMSDVNFLCTAHKFGAWTVTTPATCTKDGVETRTCEVCRTVETRAVKATGHKFGAWEITKPASLTETGVRTRTCTVCQETETQTIPKLRRGPAQPPAATQPGATQPANTSAVKSSQTGDGSQMTLWLGGALLSAAALAVLARQKKRIVK